MIKSAIILFLSSILGGVMAMKSFDKITSNVKHLLVFAGSFLFSITVIHIFPELFEAKVPSLYLSLFILGGFFFQLFLEYFSDGVEHGHMHAHGHGEGHTSMRSFSLMLALCVHSFLEGTLLAHPEAVHNHDHSEGTLLTGIVLHKIPAAIALLSVLACAHKNVKTQLLMLLIFSLSSPIGIFAGHFLEETGVLNTTQMTYLFAFVAGNFLHISTTIFIESSPEHKWNSKKMAIAIFGAGLAVAAELLI
ncbi:ZIP family metal transporter [Reichenbachiella versicolor]|uniref:ZIP family metal transporter n=1 Tax=Reichenbachiella versicolor TaxID=1821036 RepID=UPI000D6E6AAA|nr:ZIP family metal transporter [Reichenbachiella versicolor]